jgi:hypothetical protein
MGKETANLEILSTRSGFNSAVRQIKKTLGVMDSLEGSNLGDLLYERRDGELTGERIGLMLRMVLVDKLGYKTASSNLASVAADPAALAGEFAKWKAVDLIAAYHHPDMGLLVANPKNPEALSNFGALRKRELLVIYAGKAGSPADARCAQAAITAAALFEGARPKIPPEFYQGPFKAAVPVKAAGASKARPPAARKALPASPRIAAPALTAEPAAAISKGPVRMTPMYSVVVQNELFHNGNVEAWKRIIASYNAKYPELQVYIYYEGERILDINALFKWGKVKHGSAIQFAVAGTEIKDVAKLQRYLIQGASHQFEAFLRGPVSTILKLF